MRNIILFSILFLAISCSEEPDTNLTGLWIFVEPPQTPSRKNRMDDSIPVYDVIFEVKNDAITYVDLLLDGYTTIEHATIKHHGETADITIESEADDFIMKLTGCRKVGVAMLVDRIEVDYGKKHEVFEGLTVTQLWD